MRALAITAVFLSVMAWQYRKNEPLLFVIIATMFADAAMMSSRWESFTDLPLRIFSICWLICMLIAGFLHFLRPKKEKRQSNPDRKAGDTLN